MGFKDWVMAGNRSDRTFGEEMKKQIVDQIGHGAWGWGTTFVPIAALALSWWVLVGGVPAVVGSNVGWRLREKRQAADGSHVWWDPYADDLFFYLGQLVGVASGVLLLVFAAIPKSV
jgi:hypothetical protein